MLAALLVLGGLEQAQATSWIWGWSAKPAAEEQVPAQVPIEGLAQVQVEGPVPTATLPEDLTASFIQRSVDEFHVLEPSPTVSPNASESLTEPTEVKAEVAENVAEVAAEKVAEKVAEVNTEEPKAEEPKAEEPKIIEEPKIEESSAIATPIAAPIASPSPSPTEPSPVVVAASSRSWSFWDYIPFVGSTPSQASDLKASDFEPVYHLLVSHPSNM